MMRVVQAAQQRAAGEREQGLACELLDAPQHSHVCSFVTEVLLQMPASDVRAAYMSACATTLAALLQASSIAAAPGGRAGGAGDAGARAEVSELAGRLVAGVAGGAGAGAAAAGASAQQQQQPPPDACLRMLSALQQVPCLGLHVLLSATRCIEALCFQLAAGSGYGDWGSCADQAARRQLARQQQARAGAFQRMHPLFKLQAGRRALSLAGGCVAGVCAARRVPAAAACIPAAARDGALCCCRRRSASARCTPGPAPRAWATSSWSC
jgi:hypothetical protein